MTLMNERPTLKPSGMLNKWPSYKNIIILHNGFDSSGLKFDFHCGCYPEGDTRGLLALPTGFHRVAYVYPRGQSYARCHSLLGQEDCHFPGLLQL